MRQFFSLLLFFATLVSSLDAPAGPRVGGNGGDPIADEYRLIAKQMLKRLRNEYPKKMRPIDLDELEKAIDSAVVASTDRVLYENGLPKMALNYRSATPGTPGKIDINDRRWIDESDPRRIAQNVLHEFMGLFTDADLKAEVSSYLLTDPVLAYSIVTASGERAYGPWVCYINIIDDLAQEAGVSRLSDAEVERLLRVHFVAGYDPLPGFNFRYQLSTTRYERFDGNNPLHFTEKLSNLVKHNWSVKNPFVPVGSLLRRYSRDGLPFDCRPILKLDTKTGLVVGVGR